MNPLPNPPRRVRSAAGAVLLVALAVPAAGQLSKTEVPPAHQVRATIAVRPSGAHPSIDGRLDDAAWVDAAWTDGFTQSAPNPGAPASARTEVAVLLAADALYVGVRLHDARPDSVVARLGRRDEEVYSDWFYVALDGYRDRRTGHQFGVNPRGMKRDLLLYNDHLEDATWDAVWDAAARVDSTGWTAEFRIPLSQLRFGRTQASGGVGDAQTWGVNFRRQVARRGETSFWSPVPQDAAGYVSHFGELQGISGLRTPQRLEVRPYTATRLTRAPGAAHDPFYRRNDWFGSAGGDIRYGISSRFMLNATINPDFGQVEADPAVVNLTAYETFLPERRPFFVEGADIFYAGGPQLFYSRRVGRHPQLSAPGTARFSDAPTATTILGAAKLTGKTRNGWSVGLLGALTGQEEARFVTVDSVNERVLVEPRTQYAVGRLVRDFRRGQSAVGAIVTATNRHNDDASARVLRSDAYAAGVDARHRFGGRKYEVTGQLLGSWVGGSELAITRTQRAAGRYYHRPDAPHLEYDTTRTSLQGAYAALALNKVGGGHWRWGAGGSATTPGFEVNDLGYYTRADVLGQHLSIAYDAFRPSKQFRRWRFDLYEGSSWTFGQERVTTALQASLNFERPKFWGGEVGITRQAEALSVDLLRGGPAFVRPGNLYGWMSLYGDRRKPVRLEASADASRADEDGGWSASLSPRVRMRPSPRADLSAGPSLSRNVNPLQYLGAKTVSGERRYLFGKIDQTTAALTVRLSYTLTPELSIQAYAQPFVSAGRYSEFKQVNDPRAAGYENRFRRFEEGRELLPADNRGYTVDINNDGRPEYAFDDPSFNFKQFRSNAVLRWEYRPGSTLFIAWSQGRTAAHASGSFDLGRDLERLRDAPQTNVLLVKLSYWWAR